MTGLTQTKFICFTAGLRPITWRHLSAKLLFVCYQEMALAQALTGRPIELTVLLLASDYAIRSAR